MHQNGMKMVSYRKEEDMWNVVRFFGPKLKSGGLYWLFFNMNNMTELGRLADSASSPFYCTPPSLPQLFSKYFPDQKSGPGQGSADIYS